MLGAIADVTERKHAVQALAASERRFRAMFDGGAQIEMLLDLDCTCLEANRVALDFAGISLTEMRGKIIWETPSWAGSPVRVERLRKACDEAKLGKYVQYQEELDGPDGRRATIEFSIKPILGDEGQVIQLLAEGRTSRSGSRSRRRSANWSRSARWGGSPRKWRTRSTTRSPASRTRSCW
jgi:PAS domain S-box-containing protein